MGFQVGLTNPKVLATQLLYYYQWNPPQFSHFLSCLIFPRRNQTEREFLLPGHASQGALNPLACTAKRCMSLVGIPYFYVYLIRMFVVEKQKGIFIMDMGRLVLGFVIECRIWRSITRSQGSQQPPQFLHLRCCKDCHSTASGSSPHLVFTFFT